MALESLNPPQRPFGPDVIQNKRWRKETGRKQRDEKTEFPLPRRSMSDPRSKSTSTTS